MAVLDIERAVHYLLTAGSDSAALVAIRGTRCRPGAARKDDPLPYQVFNCGDLGDEGHLGGSNSTEPSAIVIESYASTRAELIDLMNATRTALHGKGPLGVTVDGDSMTIYEAAVVNGRTERKTTTSGTQSVDEHKGTQLVEIWHEVSVPA